MKRYGVLVGMVMGVVLMVSLGAYTNWNYNTTDLNGSASIQVRVDDLDTRLDAAGMTSPTTALTPTFTSVTTTGKSVVGGVQTNTGAVQMNGALGVAGTLTPAGAVNVGGVLRVTGVQTNTGTLTLNGGLLTASGQTETKTGVTVTGGNYAAQSLTVSGATTLSGVTTNVGTVEMQDTLTAEDITLDSEDVFLNAGRQRMSGTIEHVPTDVTSTNLQVLAISLRSLIRVTGAVAETTNTLANPVAGYEGQVLTIINVSGTGTNVNFDKAANLALGAAQRVLGPHDVLRVMAKNSVNWVEIGFVDNTLGP